MTRGRRRLGETARDWVRNGRKEDDDRVRKAPVEHILH
jgi:hypothetical protein